MPADFQIFQTAGLLTGVPFLSKFLLSIITKLS